MYEINHNVVRDLGLVAYRVTLAGGSNRENDATGFQLLFPDGTTSVGGVFQLRNGEHPP